MMTVTRTILVKPNPAWPKYQLFCGQLVRIRSPLETPECLENGKWRQINFEDVA
jgi:hypothetical protein